MSSHFKRLLGQIFYYGVGDAASKLITVIILPIFARYLTPSDYGIAAILTVSTLLVSGIADLGLSVSTFRFYYDEKIKNKELVLSTAMISVTVITTVLAGIAFFFSGELSQLLFQSDQFGYVVGLAFLSIPLNDISSAPINRLKLKGKAKTCTLIKIIKAATDVLLKIIFVIFLGRGLNGLFEAQLINAAIYGLFFIIYSAKNIGFGFSFYNFKKMVSFGLPFAFSTIFFWVLNWADRFILGRLTDMTEVGLYTLGYTIGMAVMLPVGAFNTAWPAFYMSVTKDAKAQKFFSLVLTYFSFAMGYFILLVAIFSRDYFVLLTPAEFHSAYIIVPLIALSYFFLGAYSIMITGTYLKKQTRYIFFTELLAVIINIGLMFILIPHLGRMGAAWATLFSYFSLLIFIYIFTKKIFPIRYEYKRLIQIAIAFIAIFWISQAIYLPQIWNLLARLLLTFAYPVILLLLGFFDKTETAILKKYLMLKLHSLNPKEQKIANRGERLIPKVAIDPEVIRHKSSYLFFKKIISLDRKYTGKEKIKIVDLGCGVGHGCYTLSKIRNVEITGIDNSEEAIMYARKNFNRSNIKYINSDMFEFLKKMTEYDYVISRGVLEHIPGGLNLAGKSKWRYRLMFDVPFNEKPGPNPHHLITKITESSFARFPSKELFYEDLEGNIYNKDTKPKNPNMILCVSSSKNLSLVKDYKIKFPLPAWQGKKVDY